MRIATSTVYSEQSASIDTLYATYQQQGQELSSGISLNEPSDDPTVIAQDLAVRTDKAVTTQVGANLSALTNQLTTTNQALSSLSNIVQSVRGLAVEGASSTLNASQQADIGTQLDQLLQEAVGIANTQYNGKYVFSGTSVASSPPPVQTTGSPIATVTSQGNQVQQVQELPNGEQIGTGVTLAQAFNFNAPNGSPSVFQAIINLRDTFNNQSVVDQSAQQLNLSGTVIAPTTTLTQLSTGAVPQIMATPLQPDSAGNYTINVANGVNQNGVNITLTGATTVAGAITAINAQTAALGITASFNYQTQKIAFTSTSNPPAPFEILDEPSAGATNTSNFTTAFGITQQANIVNNVSTQLGDIDNALQSILSSSATVGSQIQTTASLSNTTSQQLVAQTAVQSGFEDTNVAAVTSQFTETQTVLQAAYATTSRLEGKTLFDYL